MPACISLHSYFIIAMMLLSTPTHCQSVSIPWLSPHWIVCGFVPTPSFIVKIFCISANIGVLPVLQIPPSHGCVTSFMYYFGYISNGIHRLNTGNKVNCDYLLYSTYKCTYAKLQNSCALKQNAHLWIICCWSAFPNAALYIMLSPVPEWPSTFRNSLARPQWERGAGKFCCINWASYMTLWILWLKNDIEILAAPAGLFLFVCPRWFWRKFQLHKIDCSTSLFER